MEDTMKIRTSFLEDVRKSMTPMSYDTWFSPVKIRAIDDSMKVVYLEAENDFAANILDTRYRDIIDKSFEKVLKSEHKVIVKTASSYEHEDGFQKEGAKIDKNIPLTMGGKSPSIMDSEASHPPFTFDNFVVGNGNKYAHAAALAVAKSPSKAYNPLFIYGGSGLGKTHLLQAIALYLEDNSPELNVLYVSSEMFTNELIKAIATNKQREFKNKYRKVDVLIIDDIQFLAKRESIQEEFFHTFNDLYDFNKQIVIAGDRPPNELTGLSERLRSRFSWNLTAGVSTSDYETRVAILNKKAENFDMVMDDDLYDVICLIAERITDNIRELEGALSRIKSFSQIFGSHIDITFAKTILADILKNNISGVTPDKIKIAVCHKFNLRESELDSKKRTNKVAYPRQIAMYLCRTMTDYSYVQIGNYFGGRHYTTVMHACDVIQKDISKSEEKRELIDHIKEEIKSC